jgi:hypothetical protein
MVSIISISNDESSQKLHKRLTLWKTYPTYPQDFNLKNMFFGGPKGYWFLVLVWIRGENERV